MALIYNPSIERPTEFKNKRRNLKINKTEEKPLKVEEPAPEVDEDLKIFAPDFQPIFDKELSPRRKILVNGTRMFSTFRTRPKKEIGIIKVKPKHIDRKTMKS